MKNSIKTSLLFLMCFIVANTFASPADDMMRSGLKYPVVIGVLLCIFIGIGLFLIFLENRIKKLEK